MVRNIIICKSEKQMSELKSLAGLLLRSSYVVICLRLFALTVPTWFKLVFEHGCLVYFKPMLFMFFMNHIALFECSEILFSVSGHCGAITCTVA